MSHLTIASNPADADAAEAVVQHHAVMAGRLGQLVGEVVDGVGGYDAEPTRDRLVAWCREELLPHARAEEETLYRAAAELPEARLLVTSMLAEHESIGALVDGLASARDGVRAATSAVALRTLFESHLAKENDLLLTALVASPDHSVALLLAGIHDLVGDTDPGGKGAHDHDRGHSCGCHEVDPAGYPELDARAVPHAIRHATIFGALDSVPPGGGLVLVAPHDPLPLLAQIEQRSPGTFQTSYLERGPEAWRIRFTRP